ncbi:MAG: hypothetical protein M1822_001717 [Bathelium mastoideum]|nr:MAG: hypothetical protein M1822_001717 [Bathelium mastoideum]
MLFSMFACAFVATLASAALARPTSPQTLNGTCQGYTIPLSVSSTGVNYSLPPFESNFDVVSLTVNVSSRDSATFNPFSGPLALSGNYTIAAELCTPTVKTGKEKTLLLTSHGLGYYHNYWNPPIDKQYNFVDFALSQGYSVFNYDRLDTGHSSSVDGYNEAQTSQQVAILAQLAQLLRTGQYTGSLGTPSNLILVGHSYGSFISHAVVAASSNSTTKHPLADGLILTGFSYNVTPGIFTAFDLRLASTQRPAEWGHLNSGHLTWADVSANVAVFFHGPNTNYDPAVANYTEAAKQTIAVGEMLNFPPDYIYYAPQFEGPVLVLNGAEDFGVCGGNCTNWVEPYAGKMFPRAKVVEVREQPGMGHAINFHYNATGAFGVMTGFLDKYIE